MSQSFPLVSIVCLCYNHERFIRETLLSVVNQSYPNIELIIVDDGSKDESVKIIQEVIQAHPKASFLNLQQNHGMCKAFNRAYKLVKGDYVIDLAGDDVFLPERIEKQVSTFQQLDDSYGVVFSDALIIDESSNVTGTFYKRNREGVLLSKVPNGDIYESVLRSYKICSTTIMSRREVFDSLGGYDESLCYEDYDFFIRSSRKYKYHFIDESLTKRRVVKGSDSSSWYRRKNNPHLISTLKICEKALLLNQNESENEALLFSLRYHMRLSYYTENYSLAVNYASLIRRAGSLNLLDRLILFLSKSKVSVYFLYKTYFNLRYGNLRPL